MRKLRFEHIEAQLTRQRFVSFRGDKLEAGTWINEATDKPRACHAVYINAFTGDPGLALQICPRSRQRLVDLLACSLFMHTRLNSRDEPIRCLASLGAEKVNGYNLGKTAFKLRKFDLDLCSAAILDLTFR